MFSLVSSKFLAMRHIALYSACFFLKLTCDLTPGCRLVRRLAKQLECLLEAAEG